MSCYTCYCIVGGSEGTAVSISVTLCCARRPGLTPCAKPKKLKALWHRDPYRIDSAESEFVRSHRRHLALCGLWTCEHVPSPSLRLVIVLISPHPDLFAYPRFMSGARAVSGRRSKGPYLIVRWRTASSSNSRFDCMQLSATCALTLPLTIIHLPLPLPWHMSPMTPFAST